MRSDPLRVYFLYQVFLVILTIELGALLFFLFTMCIERIFSYFKKIKSEKKKRKIVEIINAHLEGKKLFDPKKKYKAFSDHYLLLTVMEAFNRRLKETDWEDVKKEIAKRYLLPRARKWATSIFWTKRDVAARCFSLEPLLEDEKVIISLIDDPVFLIRSLSAMAAVQLESKIGVIKTLEHMSREPGYAHYIYQDILLLGSPKTLLWIEEIAEKKRVPMATHLACLEVLAGKTTSLPLPFLKEDLHSTNPKIRLATLKVLNRHPHKSSAKILFDCLNDPDEQIRIEVVRGLENFPSDETIDQLKEALKDPSIKVKIQAAIALHKLGKEGIDILKKQDSKKDKSNYEVAQYILKFN